MLLNFAVTNYRSIKERQVLSLLPAPGLPHESSLIQSKTGIRSLPVALLFGANASGKSNILRALEMMHDMVLNSVRLNPNDPLDRYEPFLLGVDDPPKATEVEIECLIDGGEDGEQVYRYGFAFSQTEITAEWLYRQETEGEEVELFDRDRLEVRVNEQLFPEGKGKEGTLNANRLFLSLIAQFKGETSRVVMEWFHQSYTVRALQTKQYIGLTSSLLKSREDKDNVYNQYAKQALNFLSDVDMRIADLSIREVPITLPKDMPEELRTLLTKDGGNSLRVESTHHKYSPKGEVIGEVIFNVLHHESEGTQKVTELLGLIFTSLADGRLLVIDELDAKLHPLLTRAIIQLFTDPQINTHGAQLVFTTHDTHQLHLDYVRRDEIWFTDKDCLEATELYSHIEFEGFDPSMDITEQYLHGRYGAIPRIKIERQR